MPELPEVETTRRGLVPVLKGRRISAVVVRERRLRWRLPAGFEAALEGRRVRSVTRRAKYLLIGTDGPTLIVHLGMSGSLRAADPALPPRPHDHVELVLDHDDGSPRVDELPQDLEKDPDVLEVESGRRLIEEVDGPPRGYLR